MSLPSFTITGSALELLGNVDGTDIVGNGMGGAAPAKVTFTSNVPENRFITWGTDLLKVSEVVASVESGGAVLRNGDTVRLLANDPGLGGFTGTITWTVTIGGMQPFTFVALTDGQTITLKDALLGSSSGAITLDGGSPTNDPAIIGDILDGGAP